MTTAPPVFVLVTDLDNTLWDWFAIWYAGFSVLLDGIVAESGIEQAKLEAEIRRVFQEYGTSEYPPEVLLPLLPSLREDDDRDAVVRRYGDAVHAYHSARKAVLALYPSVLETITQVHDSGCVVVAYTESLAFVTTQRILRLGLDGLIDCLYSPPDHDLPPDVSLGDLRRYDADYYALKHTQVLNTPVGKLKPSPEVLKSILARVDADPASTVYVGDSRMKDVAMAQDVGVVDVWAKYGEAQKRVGYDLLQRVSHWPEKDVQQEMRVAADDSISPTHVLNTGFSELLDQFVFGDGRTP